MPLPAARCALHVLASAAAIAATLALAGCSGGDDGRPDPVPPKPLPSGTAAEIRRTSFGIPHIIANDEKGLGYGVGYAYAQDNFCVLADEIVTVNGERSRYFGPDATSIYQRNNLRMDFYFKLINDDAAADAFWATQSAEVRALFDGFVLGFNRYLREKGAANLPADCRNQPWVRPITTRDMMKLVRRLGVEASGIQFIDAMFAAQPPAVTSAAAPRARPAVQMARAAQRMLAATDGPLSKAHWDDLRERFGSNALALGSEATDSGRGMLFGNPHFPWFGILRFYQMHLTIPGKMDVMGGALNGFPGINIGFNSEFAWSHTVNTSAHFTLYVLQLDPADPTRYVYDGTTREMGRKVLTVQVRQADGSVVPVNRSYYSSSHGPIVVIPGQLAWDRSMAFALRDANLENTRLVEYFHRVNKAKSLAELKTIVETVVGNPWTNTVAVDRGGTAYYANVTPVPHVSTAKEQACVAPPFRPLIAASGLFVLAGSTSACEWTIDPAAPQPGIFAGRDLPQMTRRDFVHNANDSSWLTNPAAPMTGFPAIVSRDSYEQNGRTRIGLSQATARLAGTDGRPANRFSMEALREIVLSNRVYYAEAALTDALDVMCSGSLSHTVDGQTVDLTRACNVLKAWDRRSELTSVGVNLFEAFWTRARSSSIWAVPFNPADPVNTPRGVVKNNPAVTTALRDALARAVISQSSAGIPIDRPWYEIQLATKNIPLPIHGADGNLGNYNAIRSAPIGSRLPGARAVSYGTSYIQTVTWDDEKPVVGAFLSYSNSTDAASPFYADQTYRFYLKDWIRLPFTNAEVTTDPNFTSIVISE